LQEALERGKKADKMQDLEKKKKDINGVMNTLTEMCLDENIKSKLIRTKIETLVTI
jgi:dynein heavy chain